MPLETLQQKTYQNTTISQTSGSTSICSNTAVITLQLELSNIQDIYNSGESIITSAIKLLQSNQPQTHQCHRRSLLPFLGDALSWLSGTATTKDIHSIKTWINQLIATQTSQHNTLAHIVSILNITRYATQVNRHSINTLMDAVWTTSQDINNHYNLTTSLATSINFNQMILHIRSVFANHSWFPPLHLNGFYAYHGIHWCSHLRNTIATCSTHHRFTEDATTHSWHPTSNTTPTNFTRGHSTFLQYLCTHVLIENKQFLLLIDVPIQDRSCQITIHQILTLDIPHGNYSACYDVNTKYFGITKDGTMAVELSTTQFQACQQANGQFCCISTPFQPLANPPTCIAALCAKSKTGIASKCSLQICKTTTTNLPTQIAPDVWIVTTPATAPVNTMTLICLEKPMETIPIQQSIHILKLPTACSATSSNFYLPPRYETPTLDVNISINMANLHMINISAHNFCIWQHLGRNRSNVQLQHLTTIPSIPVLKIYQHLLNSTMPIMPFNTESYRFHLDPVCTSRNIHFSYRIAYTSRNWLILLLLLLVLTCQISVLIFTTR